MKPTPHTIVMCKHTKAEKKQVIALETALSRQIGCPVQLAEMRDAQGKVWALACWPMTRAERAAVAMFQRRGAKPGSAALLRIEDVEKKGPAQVAAERGLTKHNGK